MTTAEPPRLSLTKDQPAAAVEGTVVEHQGRSRVVERRPRPAWMVSGTELKDRALYVRDNTLDWAGHHATHSPYYLGWSVRGYRRLGRRWLEAHRDDHPQLIATAKAHRKAAAGNALAEDKATALLDARKAEYRRHKKIHWLKSGSWAAVAIGSGSTAAVFGGMWVDLALTIASVAVGAYHGRPVQPVVAAPQAPRRASHLGEDTMRRILVEGGAVPEKRAEEIRMVGVPHAEGPGFTCVVDLPSGITASSAKSRGEEIASALGVHKDWMDLEVVRGQGSSASRLKVWISHEDPFDVVRRSPLVGHSGVINTWSGGAPLVFGKRGNVIFFCVRETSLLVGGATRRGKGVLLANILLAAAKDPRVNIRLFDGKGSGEHNPFAPLMSTFVKKNPKRLALFLRAVLEDMDRRADFLDDRNLDKLSEDLIEEIGGLELIIVDELATYTPKGTSPFADEITESLAQIGAVGLALGVVLVSLTQVPEVDVVRGRLRQNHTGRAAVNTESATASNTILGDGMAGQGYDASKIPLDQPGRVWLATPETGTVAGRSFMVEREDKLSVVAEGRELRGETGRLPGQWRDPIEATLTAWTGVSSAAGGERRNGRITKVDLLERLEIVAKGTGRGSVTNAEVFAAFAATDPARYGRKNGEAEAGWAARVGKVIRDELDVAGAGLEVKRVTSPDGKRSQGYALDDITAARNATE